MIGVVGCVGCWEGEVDMVDKNLCVKVSDDIQRPLDIYTVDVVGISTIVRRRTYVSKGHKRNHPRRANKHVSRNLHYTFFRLSCSPLHSLAYAAGRMIYRGGRIK